MSEELKAGPAPNGGGGSLSTRRSFLAAASFGVVSLYGLWAGLGLAPLNIFAAHDDDRPGGDPHAEPGAAPAGEHGGHGAATGPGVEEFRRQTEAFAAKFRLPDGSVAPRADESAHAGHGAAMQADAPVEVYLLAQQWFFEPAALRLEAGRTYRFRMMAADMSHGASIQLGSGSHVIRLRQGVVSERDLTFKRAGEYLVYCTVYCGVGHDKMAAKIVVA
jgi:plastocyanin